MSSQSERLQKLREDAEKMFSSNKVLATQGKWGCLVGDVICACAGGAAYLANHPELWDYPGFIRMPPLMSEKISREYQISEGAAAGLIEGFDGIASQSSGWEDRAGYLEAYAIGRDLALKYVGKQVIS